MTSRREVVADQPLSKAAFVTTRALGLFSVVAWSVCVVVAWMYWDRLSWPYQVLLDLVGALFVFSREDVRRLVVSYDRYKRDWEVRDRKRSQG